MAILLFLLPLNSNAQSNQASTPELKVSAQSSFEKGDYETAYRDYLVLLKRYPKDGLFNYYTGICLLKEHKNLSSAIEYLEYASTKTMVPSDVLYYLGQAYRRNYQFAESARAFHKFAGAAGKSEVKDLVPGHEAELSGNAMDLTLQYNPFEVYESSLFTFADSNYIREIKNEGGRLSVKPEDLFTKNEKKGELTNYYFRPRNLVKGQYVYFSGYGRSKKDGADLFRSKRTIRNGWSPPEAVDKLNTEFDEIMPYYDPVSNDLYFASTGHNSMGGFDVFKSHYDQERDNWSDPINMGFPVNSPENEYLVMPGPDLGTLLLITDRQGLDSMMIVYILQMKEPKKSLASASTQDIKRIGNLGGIESINSIVDMRNTPVAIRTAIPEQPGESPVPKKEPTNLEVPTNYQSNIKKALNYQVSADSLSRLAREARIKVRELPDPNERWAWQRKIIAWEKDARDYQSRADEIYARVKQIEQGNEKQASVPDAIRKDTVINDITLYSYREEHPVKADPGKEVKKAVLPEASKPGLKAVSPEALKTDDEPGHPVAAPSKPEKSMKRFVILGRSPYNTNNPFPLDTEIPGGSFYKIQLGVFSAKIAFDTFGGLSPITAETIAGKNLTRFYTGKFSHYEDARQALEKVKQSGYSDAFIVGWYDGEKIPVSRLLELEKRDSVQ